MPAATLSPTDQSLYALVSCTAPATIDEVIARMEAIDALLPDTGDGLKWFNRLYLMVTKQVDLNPPNGAWQSPVWLTRLDVIFANLYFSAVADYLADRPLPSSWNALFQSRAQNIDRIQFALAGMNAHINHDLALALVASDAELNLQPGPTSLEFADYNAVNDLLNATMPAALTMLATDTLGMLAQDTGKIGRLLAFWDMCRARQLAWEFGDHLRALTGTAHTIALNAQDAMTGVIGRAILAFN